ncbi:MAG: histidine kinase [Pseudomonadales bacterium]|nr:histidine kinase [Porticoccaceae bacterium]MDG2035092.1 histidine kinase [Pseudomonadales bacterium]
MANIVLGSILTGQLCCETSIFRRALFHWPEQLSLIAAWVCAYLGIRFYLQSMDDRSRAIEANAAANKAESKMLRYQLQPHILFNSLNTISGLIVGDRGREADRMVQNLGHFLQHMLSTNTRDLITLDEEISYVKRYLKIEEIRFENRLTIHIDIATEVKQALVPAFILQPLVENSIKHGLNTSEGKCHIDILARLENQTIKIVVDTQVKGENAGYKPENSLGIGEKNISNRLKLHYGEKAEFVVERPADNHYRAIVLMPLIKASTSNNLGGTDER